MGLYFSYALNACPWPTLGQYAMTLCAAGDAFALDMFLVSVDSRLDSHALPTI